MTDFCSRVYMLAFILGSNVLSAFGNVDVNLEQLISINHISESCEVVIFNEDRHHIIDFLPLQRLILINGYDFHQPGQGESEAHSSWFKFNLTAECQVLVIFGFQEDHRMRYDDFVENNFKRIVLILLFPLEWNIDNEDDLWRYPWTNIWHHNLRVVDYLTSKVLRSTAKTFRHCKSLEDPICALKGVSKTVGFVNVGTPTLFSSE